MKDKLSSVLSEIKKKSFWIHAAFILFLVLLTAASVCLAVVRQKGEQESAEVFETENLPVEEFQETGESDEQEPEIPEEPEEPKEKEYIPVGDIRIPHCGEISYSISTKTSDFYFENPAENACYLKVSITRLDTKENIYSSTLISPGKSVSGISLKLSRRSSYKAMIKVDAYALDRMVHLNSLAIDTVIHAY